MTIDEAVKILQEKKIPIYLYSHGAENRSSECIVIEKRGDGWVVYDWDRGHEVAPKFYLSEDAAGKYFLESVLSLTR